MSGVSNKFNLSIHRKINKVSNGKSLVAGSLNVIFTGTVNQPGDFPAFPNIWINATTGTIYLVYRSGTDHNATKDGSIAFQKSTDGGTSWSSVVTVQPASASFVMTGPDIMQLPSGRLLVTYFYDRGSANLVTFSQYSDDDGATWSTQVQFSTDFAASGALISPGGMYVEKNTGRAFKALLYIPSVGVLPGIITYEYTAASDSWAQFSIGIISPTNERFDEPNCVVGSDGAIYYAIRSDILNACSISYSLDGGTKMSWPINSFPASGKNAIAISPNGTILILSRKYTLGVSALESPTIIAYSFDKGATWTVEDADTYPGGNLYAGVKWSTFHNQFIAVYCSVTTGGNTTTGPTQILCKRWTEV